VLERVPGGAGLLRAEEDGAMFGRLRRSESTGRPLGDSVFFDQVATLPGRDPKPAKHGPKRKGGEMSAPLP
jgi:hypothetical protein